ncbi:AMP-binding protein [Nocardioides insulae]|uniref:AMP-binding protein n=1 Tax=Nocardioides insulae TaxID=394734 RepID=UPI001B7FA65B|nr:AMP-binding protein [Nocardioides insulae]
MSSPALATDHVATLTSFYTLAHDDPGRLAIIDTDGSRLTYGELLSRANQLSWGLRAAGIKPRDAVAVVLHNSATFMETIFATAQIGAFLVPVNWRLTPREVEYILGDSGAAVVIADAEEAAKLGTPAGWAGYVRGGPVPDGWQPISALTEGQPTSDPPEREAGWAMGYTSGTSGRPKGVERQLPAMSPEEQAEGAYRLLIERYTSTWNSAGMHYVCSPLYHAAPIAHATAYLHAGHSVVIDPRFDPVRTLEVIQEHGVTSSHMVPTQFHRLLRLPEETRAAYDVSSLEQIIHAGAPCPPEVKQAMIAWFGPVIWEYLASTEGNVSVVGSEEWLAHPGTVGKPAPDSGVRLLDETGAEVGPGEEGLIYFPAPGIVYHGDPEKTAASIRDGLFTVGDVGRFDEDGYLYLLDRRSDLIISGGVNIYPAEIEAHLLSHPEVADAAVIGLPDEEWGQRVVAVVQPVTGSEIDAPGADALADRLRDHAAAGLASYKHPQRYEFLADFPRTESGKLQRRKLRDRFV